LRLDTAAAAAAAAGMPHCMNWLWRSVTCCTGGRRHLLRCTCARLRRKCRWRSLASFCYIWGCYSYEYHYYGLPNCTASHAWRA